MPRTAIAQIAKLIGRELESGAGPSEQALATGPMLAEAGATTEIVERLFAEAQRKRPSDRMIQAYAFILEGALETLRLQANGGDVSAEHEIGEVHKRVDHTLGQADFAPEVLMLLARAFARAELDPGRSLQEAMVSASSHNQRYLLLIAISEKQWISLLRCCSRGDVANDQPKHSPQKTMPSLCTWNREPNKAAIQF